METESTGENSARILCCMCGTQIEPNPANMCVACLRNQVDITEGIPKQVSIQFCRNCERYLQPPNTWISAALESRELLAVCLKRIKSVTKDVRLVDAGFIWTEPHSKRIKLKVSIQKEVLQGAVLQQTFVVEFIVHNQMCDDCHRVEAKDFWRAVVQVRQKTKHKKTIYYLEQLILKHKAHANTTGIKPLNEGIDFFYAQKQDAKKLVDFLQIMLPCRWKESQELVSHDIHNNSYNYKTTYCVELVPICKDDICILPKKLAQMMGNFGQIAICYRVTNTIHFIDPNSLQIADINATTFWRYPFNAIASSNQLQEFMVMESEVISEKNKPHVSGRGFISQRHLLAEAWLSRTSEVGVSEQLFCRTHLGHLIHCGDTVLGFEMKTANMNDRNLDAIKDEKIPDVVLIKKIYPNRIRKRNWMLKHIEDPNDNREYRDFLDDLEDDKDIRQNVNIYVDRTKYNENETSDDDDTPKIFLDEMLEDMHLDDGGQTNDVEME